MKENHFDQVEGLVLTFYEDVYRYCFFRLHNEASAQDVTQEVFCRFFQRFETYGKEKKQKQLLFTIAHHLCIDNYRNIHKQKEWKELDGSSQADSLLPLVLWDALQKLPSQVKEAMILYYYYEFKIREIAKITNTSISNVKYRLQCGKEQLRIWMKREGMNYEEWFS